jgi:hypothetical protein
MEKLKVKRIINEPYSLILHEFNKKDSEALAEIILDQLSIMGVKPEIWSYQIKVDIDSEIEQL